MLAFLVPSTTAQAASIWNVGIKTAAAQNMVAIGFMEKTLKGGVSYPEWLLAAAPWSILMSIALYFVMMKLMPPEMEEVEGGREAIRKAFAGLGPVKAAEWRLLALSAGLLGWASRMPRRSPSSRCFRCS